ncbi:hypothetical protein AtEden1_Chr1g0041941 [Arabidopsis thaliana]
MGLLFSSLFDAQVVWLSALIRGSRWWSSRLVDIMVWLLLVLCDRVSVSAVRMDWFFSSAIEFNWWTGKVDCLVASAIE